MQLWLQESVLKRVCFARWEEVLTCRGGKKYKRLKSTPINLMPCDAGQELRELRAGVERREVLTPEVGADGSPPLIG